MTRRSVVAFVALAVSPALACSSSPPQVHHGPHVLADWSRPNGLFDAPTPSDDLGPAGTAVKFPDPPKSALFEAARGLVGEDAGFSTTSAIYIPLSDAIDPTKLPGVLDSVADDSPIQLVRVDEKAPPVPGIVTFRATAGTYGVVNLLVFQPLAGAPLLPNARYAAIVTTSLKTTAGVAFEAAIDSDLTPFEDVLPTLSSHGVDTKTIAGLTVFTVGDPTAGLARARHAALDQATPVPTAFTVTDTFTDFCVFHATIDMPDFQTGTPPFTSSGGTWQSDSTGMPVWQRNETADLFVTLPRTAPPTGGYPVVVFAQAGTDVVRPLVDRGQEPAAGQPATEAGEGPARYFARAGFAGVEVDGPLGGMRNPGNADQDTLFFNLSNPGAMRDTFRESAIELDVIAHVATGLQLDATACPPAGTTNAGPAKVTFDSKHVAIMGHGLGAWIAPLAVAEEPLYSTMILSGAGGRFVNDLLYRQEPSPLATSVGTMLDDTTMTPDDPALAMVQWALEPADPEVYTRWFEARAGNVLMMQGIVDEYMLPDVANSISLSTGLDLAGTELDNGGQSQLAGQAPLGPYLPLASPAASTVALPYAGATSTRAVVQQMSDGVEDGDWVVFQTDAPKHQYQCYLASWLATGTPSVDAAASRDAACP